MYNLKELIIKAFDEGESTSVKDLKWSSLKIGKCLFFTTAFLSPLLVCILGSTFMDLESREFTILLIPLFLNWCIFLCAVLFHLLRMLQISRKRMMLYAICIAVVAVGASVVYIKRKSEVNPEFDYWFRFSSAHTDQELLSELVVLMDSDTLKVCQALVMPKRTLIRLIDGTSTSTRYASANIRHVFILSHCYGKDFILRSNRKDIENFLNDSFSNYLYPLWEK